MKKQWISVKCGLSRDPKHRQAMGESIWLFLHILDIASWDDGIAHDWKDDAAAEDMGMPVRTLREHRRKLAESGYITCLQKQYTQDIIIHNWTNPREYNGQVYNQKQGDNKTEAQKDKQGYIQGDIQGDTKDVTPTLYSKNQRTGKKGDSLDGILFYAEQGKEQGIDEVENLLVELERGLRVNIDRSLKNQQAAKRIVKDGRPLETWLSWCKSDEWRLAHLYLYADIDRVWREYPQAFDNNAGYNPQGLSIE